MKPELLFMVLFIVNLETAQSEPCQYISNSSGGKILCLNIEKMVYLASVRYLIPQIEEIVRQNEAAEFAIEIRNSNMPEIGEWFYLPWNVTGDYLPKICSVSIVNSSVETIKLSVLSNFPLKRLDISYNHITNYTFLSDLPNTVQFLNISFSEISDVGSLLQKIYSLSQIFIDLSNSNITGNVYLYNIFRSVDLSNNNVTFLYASDVRNINLAGNKYFNISSNSKFANVSLSTFNLDLLKQFDYSISGTLGIKDTEVGKLTLSANFSIKQVFSQPSWCQVYECLASLDLSNIKITDIDGRYFENYNLNLLNLSNNNISYIENLVFSKSNINILDLSNSNIEFLDRTVFTNASFQKLILSNNKLKSLDGVFESIKDITEIDLSFNSLETVTKNTFENCIFLQILNLSNNYFSAIGDDSFAGLLFLNHLELSFTTSFLSKSIQNVFLKHLVIRNSIIPQLTDRNFIGLSGLKSLSFPNSTISSTSNAAFEGLQNVGQIEYFKFNINIDFRVLTSLTTLDLSNQNLSIIPINVLKGMHNLKCLNLSNNLLSTLDKDSFVDLDNLEVLSLAYNQFGLSSLDTGLFRNLKSLTHLYLNNNYNFRLNLGIFTNLQNLKVLDLSFANLGNNPFYPMIQTLPKLEILNLENAGLYGPGLDDFKLISSRFPSLHKVDVSYNSWSYCTSLSTALDYFRDNSIDFTPANPVYDKQHLYGIACNVYN